MTQEQPSSGTLEGTLADATSADQLWIALRGRMRPAVADALKDVGIAADPGVVDQMVERMLGVGIPEKADRQAAVTEIYKGM